MTSRPLAHAVLWAVQVLQLSCCCLRCESKLEVNLNDTHLCLDRFAFRTISTASLMDCGDLPVGTNESDINEEAPGSLDALAAGGLGVKLGFSSLPTKCN